MVIGVLAGLWAAFFQSLAYLATRQFMHNRASSIRTLLVLSHVWMGTASLLALPFVLPAEGVPWRAIALPLLGTASFYLLGQIGLLMALKRAQPTQVAPMLALKLLVLAALTVAIKREPISGMQWASIITCISGTFVLNYSRADRMASVTVIALLLTCLFYALSDWSIGYLAPAFGHVPTWRAIMCGSLLTYGLCGLAAAMFIPLYGSRQWSAWRDSAPFAAAWLIGTVGLFASFAIVGVVYGGILQSTRSIMGVFMAALLTKMGHTHLEHLRSRGMFFRRLAAAVLMTLAVLLWASSRR